MNSAGASAIDTIKQLNNARTLALGDANYYSQILPAVVPIIGSQADVELQRWGAEFIAETFSSPMLGMEQKQELCLKVLDRLREYLDTPGADAGVVKSAVQAAASIYPFLFRYTIKNPTDEATWQKMAGIKSNILRRMDSAAGGIRICCLKFVQRVIQTQTPGLITDPRRPDQNETSLALVPRDHPIIPPPNLEAEASGLLDRLLGILQEDISDALLVTATLNCLGSLIRTRPSISNKIITQVLNFSPVKLVKSPMTPKIKVMVKSMEKTTRALLLNTMKKNPENPLNPRIQQYIERMSRMRTDTLDESNRKRGAPVEPIDGLDQHKRQRLGAEQTTATPELPQIPITFSYAQLLSVTEDPTIRGFDVTAIPPETVFRILVPLLQAVDDDKVNNALNVVRKRYLDLGVARQQALADMQAAASRNPPVDDDDDYEPDFQPTEDAEQLLNKLDNTESSRIDPTPQLSLGTFKLPPPEPFTETQLAETSKMAVKRLFDTMSSTSPSPKHITSKAGFSRLAASNYDRSSWWTVSTRIATRATAGLETNVKPETRSTLAPNLIPNLIKNSQWQYVVEDFRSRIGDAISWLSEEWYHDRVMAKHDGENSMRNYKQWTMKLLNGILPYLDAKDRNLLIRFLSELPELDKEIIALVKDLARDPERVELVVFSLHYLISFRPPAREICIDAVEDLWRNYDGAKTRTAKLLQRWRPQVLQQEQNSQEPPAGTTPTGTPTPAATTNGLKNESVVVVKAEA